VSFAPWRIVRRRDERQPEHQAPTPRVRRRPGVPRTAVELAERRDDGLEVVLLWDPATAGRVWVDVLSRGSGVAFVIHAAAEQALDVFYHPFVYARPAAT
jgi:hypothetical protein